MNAPVEELEMVSVTPIAQPRSATQQSEKWLGVDNGTLLPSSSLGTSAQELSFASGH
jgi:hypothetical protein